MDKAGEHWTRARLHGIVQERFRGQKLIVVSNREPYIHYRRDGAIECMIPASGLTTAVDPILRAAGGVWVAHGSGSADWDVVDGNGHVRVPPENPQYTLRRVRLSPEVERGYYYGLANEGLWPLCHIAFHRPKFNPEHWQAYRAANEAFASAVLQEAGAEPAIVFIQDYHLALLPRLLKQQRPDLTIGHFWHIPWPNREAFRAFPWKEEILDGLLGNDLLGFHIAYHCVNFLDTIDRGLEALVDTEHRSVVRRGQTTMVRPFPISIDFAAHSEAADSADVLGAMGRWDTELQDAGEFLGLGIDRIDYTKGIPDRFEAIDRLLTVHPEYAGRMTFVQVGVPSRTSIADYDQLQRTVIAQASALNARWARGDWKPVHLVIRHLDSSDMMALHKLARFCLVSSLHDGMNLVAKEFVASRTDEDGVLILSAFTGAARELRDAVLVNPFAVDEMADAMNAAIRMPKTERRRRMRALRAAVASNNVYRWGGKILLALAGIAAGKTMSSERAGPRAAAFEAGL